MTDDHDDFAGKALADPEVRRGYQMAAMKRGRDAALLEAYWKLRDHADALRETKSYRQLCQRRDDVALASERPDRHRYFKHQLSVLEFRIRGIEDGARDLAEMLGIPEHEIERPS